ncbi:MULTISPECIES: murein hydrolase activator EnvC family protein [Prosthecochloris]|uniref:Peptidase M23 n=1 Tax=Prosthecochloris vibrioformis TaxID=1098 RepID=A0A5C4RY68_PROVB|nr:MULTISPECIES: peptidoglycan DD-metalloendopeptidase family protein [Prosthecochloris]ANT65373.1 Septal ring factor [Prosthecochloris sp. CIB 2401]TNJ36246.1 peptidase M23 [Prosthecochloris vibrioformis]
MHIETLHRYLGSTAAVLVSLLLLVLPFVPVQAETELQKIMKERKELERSMGSLRQQLGEYQDKLQQVDKQEKQSINAVSNYSTQIKLLKKLISQNNRKLHAQNREIRLLQDRLASNRSRHRQLVDDVALIARSAYKHGPEHDMELFFSSSSINQAFVRARYIGLMAESVDMIVNDLQRSSEELDRTRSRLERSYRQRASSLDEQKGQMKSVSGKKKEKEKLLAELKKDKKTYAAQIRENREKLDQLQRKIEELIEAEQVAIEREKQRRLLEEGAAAAAADEAALAGISLDFPKSKGGIPWPVHGGVVTRRFGRVTDPDLNIVTTNNGIDISVSKHTPVRAVSGGIVSQVTYMPRFGNIVLLRHAGSWLTVYANLTNISAATGDVVLGGEVIGYSGTMPAGGSLVHFELWNGREKLDPETWLKK